MVVAERYASLMGTIGVGVPQPVTPIRFDLRPASVATIAMMIAITGLKRECFKDRFCSKARMSRSERRCQATVKHRRRAWDGKKGVIFLALLMRRTASPTPLPTVRQINASGRALTSLPVMPKYMDGTSLILEHAQISFKKFGVIAAQA